MSHAPNLCTHAQPGQHAELMQKQNKWRDDTPPRPSNLHARPALYRQQRLKAHKAKQLRKRIKRLEIACYGIITPAWLGLLVFIFYATHAHLNHTYNNAFRALGPGLGAFICCTCVAYAIITDLHACKRRLHC